MLLKAILPYENISIWSCCSQEAWCEPCLSHKTKDQEMSSMKLKRSENHGKTPSRKSLPFNCSIFKRWRRAPWSSAGSGNVFYGQMKQKLGCVPFCWNNTMWKGKKTQHTNIKTISKLWNMEKGASWVEVYLLPEGLNRLPSWGEKWMSKFIKIFCTKTWSHISTNYDPTKNGRWIMMKIINRMASLKQKNKLKRRN